MKILPNWEVLIERSKLIEISVIFLSSLNSNINVCSTTRCIGFAMCFANNAQNYPTIIIHTARNLKVTQKLPDPLKLILIKYI